MTDLSAWSRLRQATLRVVMGKKPKLHDLSEQIVLKAVHDRTGWRVVLHLHFDGDCTLLEGHARFPDEHACHEHGKMLHEAIDTVIGIVKPEPAPKPNTN